MYLYALTYYYIDQYFEMFLKTHYLKLLKKFNFTLEFTDYNNKFFLLPFNYGNQIMVYYKDFFYDYS
jgi:hypothetical protein